MCFSGGSVAANDAALQKAQTASTNTLTQEAQTTFAEQQNVLSNQVAKLNYMASNPLGYTPQQLHTATTSINENTATAAKQAMGSAAAYAASHGGADVGSGVTGQIAGQIASGAAQSKAGQLAALSTANQQMKQQNFWNALSGLSGAGAQLGGATGTSVGGANSAAESAVNAGSGELAAQQAGWQDIAGVLGGVGALATGGVGMAKAMHL